jgi:hypothetical protein
MEDAETEEQDCGREGRHPGPRKMRSEPPPAREVMFLRPVTRLATFPQFCPQLVVASISEPVNALSAYRICDTLVERLRALQQCLEQSFPDAFDSRTQCRSKEAITPS